MGIFLTLQDQAEGTCSCMHVEKCLVKVVVSTLYTKKMCVYISIHVLTFGKESPEGHG